MKKVLVGMSGGVDSSVATALLLESGYDVTGVTLMLRNNEYFRNTTGGCCSQRDVEDARAVADSLGIKHYIFDFSDQFEKYVIRNFIGEYESGRTPNPCVRCNRYIKFSAMLERALELGFDYIATGHYAMVEKSLDGRFLLKRSPSSKDQSYVLYSLTQEQLAHTIFPLGSLEKERTRELAEKYGFAVAHKSDSQEICFIPDKDYAGFICRYDGYTPHSGDIVDANGSVLGKHNGVLNYTIGQRKGLGGTFGRPMYVTGIDAASNTVTIGEEGSQMRDTLFVRSLNLIAVDAIDAPTRFTAKIRYQAVPVPVTLIPEADGYTMRFDAPVRSVTPGQSVVLYDGDYVVGGGVIER